MSSRKRFIDAELFSDEWFIDLEVKYKLAFVYLITNCGHDGIWKVSQKLLSFNVGENVEVVGLRRALGNRVIELENGRLWFIPKFILFQYGNNLSTNNMALKQFWAANAKYGLLQHLEAPLKPLYEGAKEKDKEKDMVMVKELVKDKEVIVDNYYNNDSFEMIKKLFISTWQRNYKNYSEILAVEKMLAEYSEKHIVQAFRRAAEMDKMNVAYVKGILKKHYEKINEKKMRAEANQKKKEDLGIKPDANINFDNPQRGK